MKLRRILLILAGLVIAVILAFFMQDVIRRAIVTPLAYLLWLLKLAYSATPQLLLWIFLLAVLVLLLFASLVSWISIGKRTEEPARSAQGNVEILAGWVSNASEGNYYKWMIANRLGKLWGEMSGGVENRGRPVRAVKPNLPEELPPTAVQRYLKAGLDESFVDYPTPPLSFKRKQATPFDLKVDEAVEFMESQMEARSGRKHP